MRCYAEISVNLCGTSASLCVGILIKVYYMEINEITKTIIGCAIKLHKSLGPGLLESAYEECLAYDLEEAGLSVVRQKAVPIEYEGVKLDLGYRMDMLVENLIVVELKAVDAIIPVHEAQVLTYLKFSGKEVGLLINFNVVLFKQGIKRYIMSHK